MPGRFDRTAGRGDERGQEVDKLNDFFPDGARWNMSRPMNYARNPNAPFPQRSLLASKRMVAVQRRTRSAVAALEGRTMIAREND